MNRSVTLPALLLAALLLASCKKESQVLKPVILADVTPASGNTTQTFAFDLTKSESRTGRGTKVFTRWDWDGDGTWDTPLTRLLVYEHRYYAPGTWKPRLEMTNLDGGADTLSFTIRVVRGQSPPRPVLQVSPEKGHIFTPFLLDATATHDDEDSLDQLSFRWDFEDDGIWDTPFGDSAKIYHIYPETGVFTPGLQVKDQSGLISVKKSQIVVTLEDARLQPGFSCIPDSVIDNFPIIMDASASSDPDNPDRPMLYRWDWNNDQVWDTEWLTHPQTTHVFKEEYIHFVRLQVKSFRGLTNEIAKKILVYHRNRVPVANFSACTFAGNVNTEFRLDCWLTRDFESAPSDLLYRWDFNGDGQWDTEFTGTVVTMHKFDQPGTYKTVLQVKDPLNEQDTCSKLIYVSHGTNQTGIYLDIRGTGYEHYGTVLIGDQWWFTRNISIHDSMRYRQYFYKQDWWIYFDYGNLYRKSYLNNICPAGWRIPSKQDWAKLFANYTEDQLYEALMPGGESDFAATLSGMGTGWEADKSEYHGIDSDGYYWSTTKPPATVSPSIWIINFNKPNRKVLRGYLDETDKQYSVRCMKDAN